MEKYKTYSFAERNGDAVITLSAKNEDEAIERLREIAQEPEGFRMEEVDEEEDDEDDEEDEGDA